MYKLTENALYLSRIQMLDTLIIATFTSRVYNQLAITLNITNNPIPSI